jgi:hypothetical protein
MLIYDGRAGLIGTTHVAFAALTVHNTRVVHDNGRQGNVHDGRRAITVPQPVIHTATSKQASKQAHSVIVIRTSLAQSTSAVYALLANDETLPNFWQLIPLQEQSLLNSQKLHARCVGVQIVGGITIVGLAAGPAPKVGLLVHTWSTQTSPTQHSASTPH